MTSNTTLFFLLFLVTLLSGSQMSLSGDNSSPECPYPCLPPPTSVADCPPPPSLPTPTTPTYGYSPPPPGTPSYWNYPPPPAAPQGYVPYYPPPNVFAAPPPPNPILPWYPWYYKTPPSAASDVRLPHGGLRQALAVSILSLIVLFLF